jgi:hypothetical protein
MQLVASPRELMATGTAITVASARDRGCQLTATSASKGEAFHGILKSFDLGSVRFRIVSLQLYIVTHQPFLVS